MRYLSYDPETSEVSLVARVNGESENWIIFNDFVCHNVVLLPLWVFCLY